MKKIFYLLMVTLLFVGCSGDSSDTAENKPSEITIDKPNLEFDYTQETKQFRVNSTHSWQVAITPSDAKEWLTITPKSGIAGEVTVSVTTTAHSDATQREAEISLTGEAGKAAVKIKQTGREDDVTKELLVDKSELEFSVVKETKQLKIKSSHSWQASIAPSTAQEWLTITPKSGVAGETTLKVSVKAHSGEPRYARIYVDGKGGFESVLVKQIANGEISTDKSELVFSSAKETKQLTVNSTHSWQATITPSSAEAWLSLTPKSGTTGGTVVEISTTTEHNGTTPREAQISFTGDGGTASVNVKCFGKEDYYVDKEVVVLQKATVGKGVDIVFMGDGFVETDMGKGNGFYEASMREGIEYFFALEPYTSHREYFNIYMVVAISQERGITNDILGKEVNTCFKSQYSSNDPVSCDYVKARMYAGYVKNLANYYSVALIMNSRRPGGVCYSSISGKGAVSLCGLPNNGYSAIQHELGGHAFGRLADEYYNIEKGAANSVTKDNLKTYHTYNMHENVDITNDLSKVLWKDIAAIPKYSSYVGAYEGGYYHPYGIYRSEKHSCMDNNLPYYNVQSRWLIYRRIMQLSGSTASFDAFLAQDNVTPPAALRSYIYQMPRHNPPIITD